MEQEYEKVLEYGLRDNALIIDGIDYGKFCDSYDYNETLIFFNCYLDYIKFEEYKLTTITIKHSVFDRELDSTTYIYEVSKNKVNDFKKSLYNFLRVAFNKEAEKFFESWGIAYGSIKETMDCSYRLIEKGKIHKIYKSARGGYNIKVSSITFNNDEIENEYNNLANTYLENEKKLSKIIQEDSSIFN